MPPKKKKKSNNDKNHSKKNISLNQNSNAYSISKDINLLNNKRKSKARNSILLFNKKRMSQIDFKLNKGTSKPLIDINKKFNLKRKSNLFNRPIQGRRGSVIKAKKKSFYSFFKGNNFSDYELNELEYQQAIEKTNFDNFIENTL
jgi:hypothetical protein